MGGNFTLSISCSACSFSLLEPIIIGLLNMEETKGIIIHNIAKLFDYNICLCIKILGNVNLAQDKDFKIELNNKIVLKR